LSKLFFLFPDPHFKRKKHKARIITPTLLAEYAHILRPGGLLYIATDVAALNAWMVRHLDAHPLFRRVPEEDMQADPCVAAVRDRTEEGIKVARNGGDKFLACYRRIPDQDAAAEFPGWDGFRPLKDGDGDADTATVDTTTGAAAAADAAEAGTADATAASDP
ncbi:tRNA (guanine-N(7)-)-methyltransferase (tRNA(m7G46)-methyltransferase), partial [Cladochytrium tenue]